VTSHHASSSNRKIERKQRHQAKTKQHKQNAQGLKGKPSYFDFFSNAHSHYVNQSKQHVHMLDSYVVKQPSQTFQEHNTT